MANEKLNLWVFWYNGMVWESSSFPMSYHRTKKGAEEAMKAHKKQEKAEYDEMYKDEERKPSGNWDAFQRWSVEKFELEILP